VWWIKLRLSLFQITGVEKPGEMNIEQLRLTVLDPEDRTLPCVPPDEAGERDGLFRIPSWARTSDCGADDSHSTG